METRETEKAHLLVNGAGLLEGGVLGALRADAVPTRQVLRPPAAQVEGLEAGPAVHGGDVTQQGSTVPPSHKVRSSLT